jgi:hypothetical protein
MNVLSPGRIRNYPRTILIVIWTGIALNWALSNGWQGWGGQILFIDFIVFYSAGLLFRTAPSSLYDFKGQLSLQQSLVAPTPLPGTGPFSHPPYVAPVLEVFSYAPLPVALMIWAALSCAALAGSVLLIRRLFSEELARLGISTGTLVVIVLSCAPIVLGLYSGQMHTFVLLGAIGVVALSLTQKSLAAGAVVGLLAIKPQLALSLGLFFLARRDLRACAAALLSFGALNAMVIGIAGWETAVQMYSEYLKTTGSLLLVPFLSGFPAYLLMTPYGLLTGLLGIDYQQIVFVLSMLIAAGFLAWFLHDTWRLRHEGRSAIRLSLGRALLLPCLLTPYWMMYDSSLLLLSWPVVAMSSTQGMLLTGGALLYGWFWICPFISAIVGVPLGVLAPVGVWAYTTREYRALRHASQG